MAEKKSFIGRIRNKHDVEANWLKAVNFIPLDGEIIIYDTDDNYDYPRIKIGDGETLVNALPFLSSEEETNNLIVDAIEELATSGQDLAPSETINVIKQEKGVLSVSKQNIAITASQVTNFDNSVKQLIPSISGSATDDDIVILTLTATYDATTNKYTITADGKHSKEGANTSKGPTANETISGHNSTGSITIPRVVVDEYGHTTTLEEKTLTIEIPRAQIITKGTTTSPDSINAISHDEDFTVMTDISVTNSGNDYTITPVFDRLKINKISITSEDDGEASGNVLTYINKIEDTSTNPDGITIYNKKIHTDGNVSTTNPLATKSTVTDAISGLAQVMRFRGVSTTNPSSGTVTISNEILTPTIGDVIIYETDRNEWVYDGSKWVELGDENIDTAYVNSLIKGYVDTELNTTDAITTASFVDSVTQSKGVISVTRSSLNDQPLTFTQASSFNNIQSGEKVSVIMGKIRKAIANLISHIDNKSNPHEVTAAQTGAMQAIQSTAEPTNAEEQTVWINPNEDIELDEMVLDGALSDTSENPVQNKAIKHAIDAKQDKIVGTAGQFVVIGDDGQVTTKTIPYAEASKF